MPNFVIIRDIFDKKKRSKIVIRGMKNFQKEQYLKNLENIKKQVQHSNGPPLLRLTSQTNQK